MIVDLLGDIQQPIQSFPVKIPDGDDMVHTSPPPVRNGSCHESGAPDIPDCSGQAALTRVRPGGTFRFIHYLIGVPHNEVCPAVPRIL
jgi:hypothetical protein